MVEVPFNYSGVFLQVEIEPLLACFTVSCLLPLEKFNDATPTPSNGALAQEGENQDEGLVS